MKKIYLLIVMVAMTGYLFGQQRTVGEVAKTMEAEQIKMIQTDTKTPSDTLIPYGIKNASGYPVYSTASGGYVVGTNGYGDFIKAQEFPVTNGYNVEGFLIWAGAKEVIGSSDMLTAGLYEMDGTGSYTGGSTDAPGTLAASVDIDVDTELDTSGGFTPAMFPSPMPRWSGKDYALGIDLTGMDDTVGIVSSADGDAQMSELSWEKWSDDTWHTLAESWPLDVDIAFLPVVDMTTTDINKHDFVNGIRMESFPNPAEDVVNIKYEINANADVNVKIMDMSGRIVKTVELGNQTAGQYNTRITTEGMNSGMYFYLLEAGTKRLAKRMMVK